MVLLWLLAFAYVALAQRAFRIFTLTPSLNWTVVNPPTDTRILPGVFTNRFTSSVDPSNGTITLLSDHNNATGSFGMIGTQLSARLPLVELSGTNCVMRQLTVNFEYTIPGTFADECAVSTAGMEAFFLLGSSFSSNNSPEGVGGVFTGGADPALRTMNPPEPWQYFSPGARAYFMSPPLYCDSDIPDECKNQLKPNVPQFSYGQYKSVTTITVNVMTGFMKTSAMDAYFNGSYFTSLNSSTAISFVVAGDFWLGHNTTNGLPVGRPFVYVLQTCLNVYITRFDIDYTDYCTSYGTAQQPSTAVPTTTTITATGTTPIGTTALQTTQSVSPSPTNTSPSTDGTLAGSSSVSQTSSETFGTTAEQDNATTTAVLNTEVPTSTLITTDTEGNTDTGQFIVSSSIAKSGKNIAIFTVVGFAVCCIFTLFICCMFRRQIRRNSRFQRIYLATPGRRYLCFFCGKDMESEATRGEKLLSVPSVVSRASVALSDKDM